MLKILTAILCFCIPALAQDCVMPFTFNATGLRQQFNNKSKACQNWTLVYFASASVSGLSIELDSANDNGNTPGSWGLFTGTLVNGTNPLTTLNGSSLSASGTNAWVSVTITTLTGSGVVTGAVYGCRLMSAACATQTMFSLGGKWCGNSLNPNCSPPQPSSFTARNFGTCVTDTATANGIFFTVVRGNVCSGGGSSAQRWFTVPVPASTPWSFTAALSVNYPLTASQVFGMGILDTSNKGALWFLANNGTSFFMSLDNCTTPLDSGGSSGCSAVGNIGAGLPYANNILWYKVINDGTNLAGCWSYDGAVFITDSNIQEAVGSFLGTQAFVGPMWTAQNGAYPTTVSFLSFFQGADAISSCIGGTG